MKCSCPDWAGMCKHVAATLYGIGARLDAAPELLFTLRDVDHLELISQAVAADNLSQAFQGKNDSALSGSDLGEIFGIELEGGAQPDVATAEAPGTKSRSRGKTKPVITSARRAAKAPKKAVAAVKKRKAAAGL